eukprot:s325_g8.t1
MASLTMSATHNKQSDSTDVIFADRNSRASLSDPLSTFLGHHLPTLQPAADDVLPRLRGAFRRRRPPADDDHQIDETGGEPFGGDDHQIDEIGEW